MKPVKIGLRIWLAITSIISFLGGWALLSHAGKPVPLVPTDTSSSAQPAVSSPGLMPTLAPVPSIDDLTNGSSSSGLQQLPSIQTNNVQQQFFPRMRTRGS